MTRAFLVLYLLAVTGSHLDTPHAYTLATFAPFAAFLATAAALRHLKGETA